MLWVVFLVSLSGYFLVRRWFPLPLFFNQSPLADIRRFTPSLWGGFLYAIWLCVLFALYGFAYRQVRSMDRPPDIGVILLGSLLFGLPLLQTFPINATDVYRYVIRGRISSAYDDNPFATPPDAYPADPFLPLAGEWAGETSPYGPVWETVASAVTAFSQENLLLGLTLFKGLGLIAHLAIAYLIWRLQASGSPAERVARALLWAWNPALLLTFVVDGHNDALMLFWLLLGWWIVGKGRPAAGFACMVLAPLTKPIGLLPLPFFFLAIWRQLSDNKSRGRFIVLSLLATSAAVWLTFLPFGSPLDLATRLLREASSGGGFSIQVFFILVVRRLGSDLALRHVNSFALILAGLVVLWLLRLAWRGREPVRGVADIFILYILQALNFRIWYSVWPFAWLLLDEDRGSAATYRLQAGFWLLLTAQLSVLIYGHLRVYLLGGDHFPAHLIGVPFTFGLPFLLAYGQKKLSGGK
jgi:alpha-1,6-mannosyltransferase